MTKLQTLFLLLCVGSWCIAQEVTPHTINIGNFSQGKKVFAFAVIADPHIGWSIPDYGSPGHDDVPLAEDQGIAAQRLRKAVAWLNKNHLRHKISFVSVQGDITDSAELSEYLKAREILDTLEIPYIPVLGNHDMWPYSQTTEADFPNGDKRFQEVFHKQFSHLAQIFSKWQKMNGPVWNGEADSRTQADVGGDSYFQNFAFDYKGFHFVVSTVAQIHRQT